MKPLERITALIKKRKSIRTYKEEPLLDEQVQKLKNIIEKINKVGPFGNTIRYELILLTTDEISQLNTMINYGFIKGSPAFIAGMMTPGDRSLEDFGYLMEDLILQTVEIGLDTCWLGGSLNKSSFLERLKMSEKEFLPAIFSIGLDARKTRAFDNVIRSTLKGDRRKDWDALFFDGKKGISLEKQLCGDYLSPLEMVRLAPSASNKQPWRIIRDEKQNMMHFFFVRDKVYSEFLRLRKLSDLQKMDMGIAMSHFELTTAGAGLKGEWLYIDSKAALSKRNFDYSISWKMINE